METMPVQAKHKNSKYIPSNFRLPPQIVEPLNELSVKTGTSKSELVRRALEKLFKEGV